MSKIQFWKQFTTDYNHFLWLYLLYSICQRYNFESNLQRKEVWEPNRPNCIRYVKDTILKAIYNVLAHGNLSRPTVFDMSKIQFWKQFTTVDSCFISAKSLYSICQRYNFESNLQQHIYSLSAIRNCIRYVKDTILKAIYNLQPLIKRNKVTVFDMSKIQFWKQFTTGWPWLTFLPVLYSICQRYNFESNLQHYADELKKDVYCIRYVKDTILKAIYNNICVFDCETTTVFDMSKIQFWKQFTTKYKHFVLITKLYSICQRYNFESNLQLPATVEVAIFTVFDMSKIQFWKQFTTLYSLSRLEALLYSICQRYNFESNLQRAAI